MASFESVAHGSEARQRILDAAAEVFAERGFAGAGVNEIARRAGVNKAMLYYHIGDKAALYTQAMLGNMERVQRSIVAAVQAAESAHARVRGLVLAVARAVVQAPHFPQLMLRALAAGGADLPVEVLSRMREVLGITRQILADGEETGQFRPVHPLMTHLLIVSSITVMTAGQKLVRRMHEAGLMPPGAMPESPEDLAEFVTELLLNGIARKEVQGGIS